MATTSVGRRAEDTVARHLENLEYKVQAQNWKTPRCEIDIIAMKNQIAYLVEVKYRSNAAQGSGFEYIGRRKLKQMEFAAQVWAKDCNWGGDIQLLAAEVSADFGEIELLEI